MNGFLVYSENHPIGWCNINLRDNFAKELYDYDSQDSKEKKIAGIVCFLIGHTYRKQGIARKLLKYAISHYTDKGYDIIESYPRVGELSDAHSYRGPVSLYESEGFTVYKELKDLYVMRKEL
jgi:ribosomal protein S18 acetylase RimI-like enzyme